MSANYKAIPLFLIAFILTTLFMKCKPEVNTRKWDMGQGYVPDSTTAVQLAQVFFVRIYGEKVLEKKPFISTLKDDKIWVVDGTLGKGMDGGVPHIEIQKSDGKVLMLYHGK
ncbi:hypothetical protein QF042_000928 [Pedobacter sp. W3I1]|uniref:YbbC/YhhH family protein n=1 Tax=Pedobacter sp. W3I1 TaxID=3042291 RepID=UPI002784993F|nr:YbbC/YhhH family protein [Pedobacter sp. W3I1]MDQ0637363.1 hypothetical protein [Pedobacter sp. W3I1]